MQARPISVGAHFLSVALVVAAATAQAQEYPSKPITLLTGEGSGATNLIARRFANVTGTILGQKIVVDNRAGQLVATSVAKRATPDGYTLFLFDARNTMVPAMQTVDWDPIADFVPITKLTSLSLYLVVAKDSPVKSMKDLVELARKKPGGLSYGSPGVATPPHFTGELFGKGAGISVTHVPYKSITLAVANVAGGQLDFAESSIGSMQAMLDTGRVRVIAFNGKRRSPVFPDVPTMTEQGYPGLEVPTWWGIVAPRGVPRDIVEKLFRAFGRAASDPALKAPFEKAGIDVSPSDSPEEFGREIASYAQDDVRRVKATGIKIQF